MCENTNKYDWMHILDRQTYAQRDGSSKRVTPLEILKFIGIIIYMGMAEVLRLHLYWKTTGIFRGPLPPNIMPRKRFSALLVFLHVSDPEDFGAAASVGKTWKVYWLLKHINQRSARFFQPRRDLSVDERMVKSKARSGIRQYIRDKSDEVGIQTLGGGRLKNRVHSSISCVHWQA